MLRWIHLLGVGVWLGCILTEFVFERTLMPQGRQMQKSLARLHWRVDLWVEGPALVVVLATGLLQAAHARTTAATHLMVALGLLAIAANVYCIALVLARCKAAEADDWEVFASLDQRQHRWGAVVFAALLGALVAGAGFKGH